MMADGSIAWQKGEWQDATEWGISRIYFSQLCFLAKVLRLLNWDDYKTESMNMSDVIIFLQTND